MNEEKLLSYDEYVKQFILNDLEDCTGTKFEDARALADRITEGINADGTATYWRQEAIDYIKEWWYEAGEFIEEYELEFGEKPQHNPFSEPELFHALMVIIGCEKMLGNLECLKERENFTLTKTLVNKITAELN